MKRLIGAARATVGGVAAMLAGARTWLIVGALATAVAGAGGVYVMHLRASNAELEANYTRLGSELAKAMTAADANRFAYERARADAIAANEALARAGRDVAAAAATAARLQERIDNAPDTDDGPVAYIILHTLDGLRAAQGRNGSGHCAGGRKAGCPQELARVQERAGSARAPIAGRRGALSGAVVAGR